MAANPDENTPRVVIDAAQLLADLPPRVAQIETHIEYMRGSLGDLKVEVSDLREVTKQEFSAVAEEFKKVRAEMRSDFRWLLALYLAGFTGLLGAMAKGFHWL